VLLRLDLNLPMSDSFIDLTYVKIDYKASALRNGVYEGCVFDTCDFFNSAFTEIRFLDCKFSHCNLSLVSLKKTALRNVDFTSCKMLGLQFKDCNPFGLSCSFMNCSLNHSSLYQTKFRKTVFQDCLLQEVDFTDCDMTGSLLAHCDLDKTTFENTILEKADLRTSFNYSIDPERNRIRKARFSLNAVGGLLDKYDIIIE